MPEPGWYPDPADPTKERWWGGVEWTHDVRPLAAAPVVAPQTPLLNVPGGGVNPFAALDAEAARQKSFNVGQPSIAMEPSFSYASHSAMPQQFGMSGPTQLYQPPSNGMATAGVVLSALGVSLLGLLFSAIGMKRARAFAQSGERAVGLKRAGWGIALALIMPALVGSGAAIGFPAYRAQQISAAAAREGVPVSEVVLDAGSGLPLIYTEREAEDAFYELAAEEGMDIQSVSCPATASMVVGKGFECSFTVQGVSHTIGFLFTSTTGDPMTTLDGVQVQN